MGWSPPSQEWAIKLVSLIKDSMTLLKDAIDQSKPFFLLPQIQKEGQDFLEKEDSKASLKLILNYLIEQNILKLDNEKAKELIMPLIEAKKEVHLNLKDVSYMDSSGISVLIESHQKALENNTKVIVSLRKIWSELNSRIIISNCFNVFARVYENVAQIIICRRIIRFKFNRLFIMGNGIFISTQARVNRPNDIWGLWIIRGLMF